MARGKKKSLFVPTMVRWGSNGHVRGIFGSTEGFLNKTFVQTPQNALDLLPCDSRVPHLQYKCYCKIFLVYLMVQDYCRLCRQLATYYKITILFFNY